MHRVRSPPFRQERALGLLGGDRTGAGAGRNRCGRLSSPARAAPSSGDKKAALRRPPLRFGRRESAAVLSASYGPGLVIATKAAMGAVLRTAKDHPSGA